ncbi:Rib/alpha-like domain-containing protein [Corynebacterium pseudogenitalium]|uniref:YPDG domain-containing protein n=1 Tax=Corynebacterium pseudogenitalium TaxID=38303 RepID=A0ABD4TRH6_9CORY|nr:Rib/alpha-like domain-containing protein [Corynebacterium pseudogenitalium]MCQ4614928.1 YPDG domain-containing protein [Corynebacterium pseudogenitalium]
MNYKLLAAGVATTCAISVAPHATAAPKDAEKYQPSFHTEARYLALVEGQLYTEITRFAPTGAPAGATFRVMGQEEEEGEPVVVSIDDTDHSTLLARLRFLNCDQVEAGQLYGKHCRTVQRGENTRDVYIEVTYPDGSSEDIRTKVSLIADQRLIYEPVYKPVEVTHGASFTVAPFNLRERVELPTDAKFELIDPPVGWDLTIDPVTGTVTGTATDAAQAAETVTVRATFEDGTARTAGLQLRHDGPNPAPPQKPQTPPADSNGSSGSRALVITLGVLSTLAVVGTMFVAFASNIPALAPYLPR